MNANDRAAIRWALRNQPGLYEELARDAGWTEYDAEREALDRAAPCDHYARTDWLNEQTCGCGAVVEEVNPHPGAGLG